MAHHNKNKTAHKTKKNMKNKKNTTMGGKRKMMYGKAKKNETMGGKRKGARKAHSRKNKNKK